MKEHMANSGTALLKPTDLAKKDKKNNIQEKTLTKILLVTLQVILLT